MKKKAPSGKSDKGGEIEHPSELESLYRTYMTGCLIDSKKNTEEMQQHPPSGDTPHREAQDEDTRRLQSHHKIE